MTECRTCEWWVPFTHRADTRSDAGGSRGQCVRRAPVAVPVLTPVADGSASTNWPITSWDDRCGEWYPYQRPEVSG